MRIDGPQITGSLVLNSGVIDNLEVFVTTGSLNTYTSSVNTTMGHVMTATHSLNTYTSSANNRFNAIEGVTGSYATTGSNLFKGSQTISGSVIPAVDNTYDLGSTTHQFRDLYLSSASLYIDGTKVLSSTTQELQITTDAGQSFKILESGSDTITLQSNDGNITLATSGGGDVILDPTTGIIALKGTTQVYAGNKVRSSDGNNIVLGDGLTVSGSITVTGFIETQELRTTYISSSILYRSGSTKFGDELDDTHSFTGSLLVSGSISVPGSGLISGSAQILNGSGIWSGSAQLPSGVVSGSAQVSFTGTTGYSTYINQAVLTTSNPTFNSVTSGDIRYSGTGYITYDVANSGTDSLVVRKYGTTVLTLNSSGYLGVNVNPAFYLDVQSNVANTFYTIAQFENRDYTSGTRSFIRVRNWLSAGGSYSSYFGQGQDGKTYIIANNSARGGDIVIDGGNGYIGINQASPTQRLHLYDAAPASGVLAKLESGNASGWLQLTSTGTSWQIGATATGLQFWNDNETSTKLTVLTGGSILMNQDVAIRAGTSQNWILGQDSGTNLIHMGSTGVANDIRFDSSTGSGIVMIKSNGNFGIGLTTPQAILDVSHTAGTTNIIRVSNGSGNYRWRVDQGFSMIMTNASGVDTFSVNTSGTISTNSSITATTGLFNVNASSTISLTSAGTNASMVKAGSGDELYLGGNDTWQMRLSGGNILMDNGGNVGIAISSPQQKLSVGGSIRANRSIYNWFQAGSNDWDGYQYLHLKTNMRSGAGGNVDHTMSLFYGRLYSYSSAYIREGHYGFHNWSGTLYNPVTTGNFWAGGYSSSDGYVVLIVALGGGSYLGINIDWHQSYPYEFRDRIVTSYNHSNSASALY